MMLYNAWILLLGALLLPVADAIYKDDVGVLDFSVATAGHGPVEWASFHGDLLLTSAGDSCFVAARSIESGSLAWRRNVCSTEGGSKAVAVSKDTNTVVTVDNTGIVRSWSLDGGGLLWDVKVATDTNSPPSIFFEGGLLGIGAGSSMIFLAPMTGANLSEISVSAPKDGQHVEWLALSASQVAVAVVDSATGILSDFSVGRLDPFKPTSGKLKGKDVLANTVVATPGFNFWAVTASGSAVSSVHGVISPKDFDSEWTSIVGVQASSDDVVSISGKSADATEATMEAFRYDGTWKRISVSSANSAVAIALGVVVTTPMGSSVEVHDYSSGKALDVGGDVFGSDGDSVTIVSVQEDSESAKILIGTERGSTTLVSLAKSGSSVELSVHWTAEEGLSSLSSAIILDASHLGSDDLVEEQDSIAYKLSMAGRLKAQWQEIGTLISTMSGLIGSKEFNYRDHLFGFLKVSALLSSETHRMWGMSTGGADRGSIRWSLDLPKTAVWHSMVHGTSNAANLANGIHGDTHSREILVLSASPGQVDWMCIDGTSGAINAQDSVAITSPIQQVVPVYGSSTGGCRQASLLLGEDLSLTVVPADAQTESLVQTQLQKTPNGFYTHQIDRSSSTVHSYRVTQSDGFAAVPVGMASFEGEEIVEVAYPMRHEDIQSMSTILGDNSLLLKYVNPHMVVVVTMLSDEKDQSVTDVATALGKEAAEAKKRKPVGVGAPGSSTTNQQPSEELPNMFVNLVDTVSGRVLYRHSHSLVDPSKNVSVVVSENWVVYSYVSSKTRRTEIGVLTLHEGMIEPKGLTYFAHPEQSSTFSSFDSRESKPVVLSKVYAFPKAVTALGVTSTKQGISRQNILLASSDGSLSTINKMILETRRPLGEVKPEEKKEGLIPYKEVIPGSPLLSLNYNQTMEPFQSIVSTTTSLESQSLVFGFGGPDLFFTRTSPTRGFDLLPETFNKMLVGMSTVGIVVALLIVQRMGSKKALKQSWS
mmetsp:Transcript_16370/g.33730  ORF Transcript_16370/g.33730 Transcript_16370/m.33730 type:complete len:990 (-) Transcript_16370:81-3050(-)